jgi:hypothetical protein
MFDTNEWRLICSFFLAPSEAARSELGGPLLVLASIGTLKR